MRCLVNKEKLSIIYIQSYDFLQQRQCKKYNPLTLCIDADIDANADIDIDVDANTNVVYSEYDIFIYIIDSKPVIKFINSEDMFVVSDDDRVSIVLEQLESICKIRERRLPLNIILKRDNYINCYYNKYHQYLRRLFDIDKLCNADILDGEGKITDILESAKLEVKGNKIVVWNNEYLVNTYLDILFQSFRERDLICNSDNPIIQSLLELQDETYAYAKSSSKFNFYVSAIYHVNTHKQVKLAKFIDCDDIEAKASDIFLWNDFNSEQVARECLNKIESLILLGQLKDDTFND